MINNKNLLKGKYTYEYIILAQGITKIIIEDINIDQTHLDIMII
jgi:hypothetical protein